MKDKNRLSNNSKIPWKSMTLLLSNKIQTSRMESTRYGQ